MDNKKVGKTISNLRKKHGMTQMQLGEKLYVSDKAVSRWETGEGLPEILNLIELSKIFNVSMEYILKGEGADDVEQTQPFQESKEINEPYYNQSTTNEKQFTQKQTNKEVSAMTIISIVLGGISILCNLFSSFVALIFAIIGLVMSKAQPGEEKSSLHTLAKVLNIIAIVLSVALVVVSIILFLIFGSIFGSMFGQFFELFNDAFESMNNSFNNFMISLM